MIPRYTRPEMAEIWSDENRFRIWLRIEILACEAMAKRGEIPARDLALIRRRAKFDVHRIAKIEATTNHDVIAFLTNVAENVGPAARHIHRGLTSSDILDTALAVQMVQAADLLIRGARAVRAAAARQARRHKFTPMIGRTHGVHAEPITFGLKMALMYDEFGRAVERLERAREIVRVGKLSGAVGTHAHIDPAVESYVCHKLGLRPDRISTQIVQRDRHAEYVAQLALVATSVERWAQEFRHLQRTEVHEVEEFFGRGQKGSSAMPHKKNPILAERLCGMARLIRGYALAAYENVALWHERDISHSSAERVLLPDATIALDYMLAKLADFVENMRVFPDRMISNLNLLHGLIHSQPVMLRLTERGMSREDAYRVVQQAAMEVWESGREFREVIASKPEVRAHLQADELDELFDLRRHFRDVNRKFRKLGL
ncbi:MAG: adenylosuccinate lyase [Kiritimatiellae bacterium]|nr:adenylosuccinate lyase [Kiritimatiellia bacterium]